MDWKGVIYLQQTIPSPSSPAPLPFLTLIGKVAFEFK